MFGVVVEILLKDAASLVGESQSIFDAGIRQQPPTGI